MSSFQDIYDVVCRYTASIISISTYAYYRYIKGLTCDEYQMYNYGPPHSNVSNVIVGDGEGMMNSGGSEGVSGGGVGMVSRKFGIMIPGVCVCTCSVYAQMCVCVCVRERVLCA